MKRAILAAWMTENGFSVAPYGSTCEELLAVLSFEIGELRWRAGVNDQALALDDIDLDTQTAISGLLARGVPAERVAAQIGASLTAVRLVARAGGIR